MKLLSVLLFLLLLMMISNSMLAAVLPENQSSSISETSLDKKDKGISEELTLIDPGSLGNDENKGVKISSLWLIRRGCGCWKTTGRCMSYGSYQCYFVGGPSIVQYVGGNNWIQIGRCPSSCKSWGNDQPYCS